ncbi:hypothetical protein A8V01_15495 [Novosphingobium guangzhouense]|uniref:Uncharacterized protein n=1 Tax=Novosphingobium guangzhouense TaxID=1850347 RepID=A0A2K2G3E8_9SPHN|nr:hypothetical protein [Novosphingobium guangzhouense]PNU05569.1 hypothetical protein A8V01_15495 [Novosphingobium guangzhouense]
MQQNGIQRLTDAFDLDTSVVRQITLVEVLKGPAAALVARGEPSGTINLPSKQAELGRSFRTAAIQ